MEAYSPSVGRRDLKGLLAHRAFRACQGTKAKTAVMGHKDPQTRKAFRACRGTMAKTAKMGHKDPRARKAFRACRARIAKMELRAFR